MAGFFDKVVDIATAPITSVANTLQGAWNDYSGKTATEMSINAAKQNTAQQIAWERERATNAHQWEVKDLEKAGLNPILSAGGSGAATGGISPQMPDFSKYKGTGGALAEIGSLLMQQQNTSTQMNMNYEKILSDIETNESLQYVNRAKAYEHLANSKKADQETLTSAALATKEAATSELIKEQNYQLKLMRGEIDEKLKQGRAKTILLLEEIKNAPDKAAKLKAERELAELKAKLFEVGKYAAIIGSTVGTGGGLIIGAMKYKKVYKLGKKALKILNNVP